MTFIDVKTADPWLAKHLLLFDFDIVILVVFGKVCFTGIFRVWKKGNERRRRILSIITLFFNFTNSL